MRITFRRAATAIVVVAMVGGAAWALFGWTTATGPIVGSSLRAKRFFGRVTTVEMDVNGDGAVDEVATYTWQDPSGHHNFPKRIEADRNFDGVWDTWIALVNQPVGEFPVREYHADTNGDGGPDLVFLEQDPSAAWKRIEDARGY